MELLEGIMTRKSIRAYDENRPISEETLQKIVEAGMNAPTAMEQYAWRILTIRDRGTLTKMTAFNRWWQMLRTCSAAAVVMTDVGMTPGNEYQDVSREVMEEYQLVSAAAATENMLLAAHGLGLGAVWLGISQSNSWYEEFRTLLNIPHHLRAVSVIAMGYPRIHPQVPGNRFEDAKWIREHF